MAAGRRMDGVPEKSLAAKIRAALANEPGKKINFA